MKDTTVRVSILIVLIMCTLGLSVSLAQKSQKGDKSCCDANPKDGDAVVAVINGSRTIREKEIDETVGTQLYSLQERIYNLRKRALDNLITQILLRDEASKRAVTEQELRVQLMPAHLDVKKA